ncbi:hypothetical protein PR202_gb23669 [Eleusine coracana subsp. coracana]|uniref:VWFA domain-containing protein n=1 Tax=Eleusine coracana subsp. coracana TaxID=191504 RepID=A0AAV5FJ16_ELECO|nr:hypothetical protein PR202_gb23669 [Eleusine coracana subsp. coracana]
MTGPAASLTETQSRLDMLKKAMKFLLGQLNDDDRLSIIAFNDQVIKEHSTGLVEISTSGRSAIETKIDGLIAKGDTALKPSLEHAVELLDGREDKNRAGFIILISDGLDNSKFEWTDESTALHREESCGTYSSIADNLETKIMEALAVCLGGLKTVVAVNTCLNITSGSLKITRIDSGGYPQRGGSGSIFIGILSAGEVKDFVVYFNYTTGSWSRGYNTVLSGIIASVTYKDVPGKQSTFNETCSISLPIHTTDTGRAPENPCPPLSALLLQMIRSKVVDLLKSIMKDLLVLKQEAGRAVHRGEDDDPVLQAMAASSLQRKWKEFKQSDASWKEAPRAFLDLGGIDNDINAMVGILQHGLGVWCIYSWLSSYEMQRGTVTGLPYYMDGAQFRTPAIEAMVKEAHKQLANEAPAQEMDETVCNNAIELLDMIDERFELWSKLEHDMPPPFQPSSEQQYDESLNSSASCIGTSAEQGRRTYICTTRVRIQTSLPLLHALHHGLVDPSAAISSSWAVRRAGESKPTRLFSTHGATGDRSKAVGGGSSQQAVDTGWTVADLVSGHGGIQATT